VIEIRDGVVLNEVETILRGSARPEEESVPVEAFLDLLARHPMRGATLYRGGEPQVVGIVMNTIANKWFGCLLSRTELAPYKWRVARAVRRYVREIERQGGVLVTPIQMHIQRDVRFARFLGLKGDANRPDVFSTKG